MLNPQDQNLLDLALTAVNHAKAQFSHFQVGTAARLADGTIVSSSNMENTSLMHCAEQSLLLHLHSSYREFTLTTVAVAYKNMNPGAQSIIPITPCGKCRQLLLEAEISAGAPIRVIMGSQGGKVWAVNRVASLLPLAYSGYI